MLRFPLFDHRPRQRHTLLAAGKLPWEAVFLIFHPNRRQYFSHIQRGLAVDFPDPDGPRITPIPPFSNSRLTPRSAFVSA